jgi:membrane-associated phospholipid phosphatase
MLWLLLVMGSILADLHFYLQDIIIIVPAAVAVLAAQPEGRRWLAGCALAVGWLILGYGSTPTAQWNINLFTSYMGAWFLVLTTRELTSGRFDRQHRPPLADELRGAARKAAHGLRRAWILIPVYAGFFLVNVVHATFRSFGDDVSPFEPQNTEAVELAFTHGHITVWLQELHGAHLSAMTELGYQVWQTLFYVPLLLVAYVALAYGKGAFLRLLLLHAVLVLSADVIYAIVPTKPPWMDIGVVRIIELHIEGGVHLDRNPYAALPSLHVGVPFAYGLWFARQTGARARWLGPALIAWSFAMGWSVMYLGEHYLIDVVTGYIWAGAAYFALEWLGLTARRRRAPVTQDAREARDGPHAVPGVAQPVDPSTKAA